MVSAFDFSASWVGVSRCDIESSYILIIVSTLYHELVCHVEHYSVELRHFIGTYDMTKELQLVNLIGSFGAYKETSFFGSKFL